MTATPPTRTALTAAFTAKLAELGHTDVADTRKCPNSALPTLWAAVKPLSWQTASPSSIRSVLAKLQNGGPLPAVLNGQYVDDTTVAVNVPPPPATSDTLMAPSAPATPTLRSCGTCGSTTTVGVDGLCLPCREAVAAAVAARHAEDAVIAAQTAGKPMTAMAAQNVVPPAVAQTPPAPKAVDPNDCGCRMAAGSPPLCPRCEKAAAALSGRTLAAAQNATPPASPPVQEPIAAKGPSATVRRLTAVRGILASVNDACIGADKLDGQSKGMYPALRAVFVVVRSEMERLATLAASEFKSSSKPAAQTVPAKPQPSVTAAELAASVPTTAALNVTPPAVAQTPKPAATATHPRLDKPDAALAAAHDTAVAVPHSALDANTAALVSKALAAIGTGTLAALQDACNAAKLECKRDNSGKMSAALANWVGVVNRKAAFVMPTTALSTTDLVPMGKEYVAELCGRLGLTYDGGQGKYMAMCKAASEALAAKFAPKPTGTVTLTVAADKAVLLAKLATLSVEQLTLLIGCAA